MTSPDAGDPDAGDPDATEATATDPPSGPGVDAVRAAVRASGRGELCWVAPDGSPRAAVLTPLLEGGVVVLALSHAERELALAVAAAGQVALALPGRGGPDAGAGVLLVGRVVLEADPDGARFVDGLLDQHLAKHPPSRALADSVILRREHWWYVPRLLLRVEADALLPMPPRPGARSHPLLVVARPGTSPQVVVTTSEGRPVGEVPADGAALLVSHDAADDLERTVQLLVPGRVAAGRFVPDEPPLPGLPPLPGPPGLLERWSRLRALRRACIDGLRAAGLA
ncbi:hypothetical protein [Aquipuribacter sp. MA13-6]|uniref:hypothetical protein n=1 Tax=unclassified Aquipuribacter TaxID=2635084 RepID=UPI003EEE1549